MTHYLGGENYVFWGGREGYQSLLNTDMERELDHLVRLFQISYYGNPVNKVFQCQLLLVYVT